MMQNNRNTLPLKDLSKFVNSEEDKKRCYEIVKRCFDIVFATFSLMITSPIFLVLTILLRKDGGTAFYVQTRVGKDGTLFKMYKFRSMCMDAEQMRDSLEDENDVDGPVFKMKEDPRITKLGRFIRKYSLDELPQIINVLKGEMTFVGPRPSLPKEVEKFSAQQQLRLKVKQGITCYWQCQGRNELSFEKWMELDEKYVRERSMKTDIYIILATIPAVLSGRGAN